MRNLSEVTELSNSQPSTNPPVFWLSAVLFAFGVFCIGMIPGFLTFAFDPNAMNRIRLDAVPIPGWVFTAVWIIAYPGMGIATWLVWRKRREVNTSIPIAIFVVGLIQTLGFWFTTGLQMTAVLDGMVLLMAYTMAYVYFQYDKRTIWWLLPWLLWMPITFAIKIWVISNTI